LPVSIGIASIKTLAKIASRKAKKSAAKATDDVFCFTDQQHIDSRIEKITVEVMWGIGTGGISC